VFQSDSRFRVLCIFDFRRPFFIIADFRSGDDGPTLTLTTESDSEARTDLNMQKILNK